MAESNGTTRTMKRRGILAAAGAVAAGIAAKQVAQPVAAAINPVVYSTDPTNETIHFPAAPIFFQSASPFSTTFPPQIIQVVAESAGVDAILGNAGGGRYGIIGLGGNGAIGVYGSATNGTGVFGVTTASNQYGVLGTTYATNSTAVAGTCVSNGSSAFSGGTGNANAFAAYFQGHVQVDGPFDVIGAGNKHAAVAHPDGSHRTIYSMESPEAWVEDFGTGTLTAGQATVKFDVDFALLIETGEYHVFLTPHADTNGLHVTSRTATAFTVQEHKGGTANLTFSWRIVARPKTTAKVGRLAKVNIADAKALLPDPAKLPKPPEAPKAPMPKTP